MRSGIIVLAVTGVLVNAQASVNSTLIPSNITSSCSTFLNLLNSDTTLSTCVSPLINTTSSFSPTSGSNLSQSDINYTLADLCKTNAGCGDSTIRGWLTNFYASCQPELTSSSGYNSQVRELYDILYVVNPLKSAVCSIDSANQEYCVNEIYTAEKNATTNSIMTGNSTSTTNVTTTNSSSSAAASGSASAGNGTFLRLAAVSPAFNPIDIAANNLYITITTPLSSLSKRMLNYLSARQAQVANMATIITPNATTYRSTNLPFLFLQPDMSNSQLCTPCTRQIMAAYIKWEMSMPYALGLAQSPILGGQSTLWTAINSTCGTSYVNAITSQVGGTFQSANTTSGALTAYSTTPIIPILGAAVAGLIAFVF